MTRRWMSFIVVMFLARLSLPPVVHAQKLVFVVRHAERADTGAMKMQAQVDPPLSAAGEERAAMLAGMLGDSGIRAIYVTEFRRTQDTARPLAAKLGLKAQSIPSKNTPELAAKLHQDHADDIVLVVGHSNTVSPLIQALGGPAVTIADDEYDNLFIVVPGTGTLTRIRFRP
jgi:2,3-bisphosphoglycerate-dependent phosphoglycerate mutase